MHFERNFGGKFCAISIFVFSSKFDFFGFLSLLCLKVVFELTSNFASSVPTSKSHSLEILQSESRRNNLLTSKNVVFRCRMTLLRP